MDCNTHNDYVFPNFILFIITFIGIYLKKFLTNISKTTLNSLDSCPHIFWLCLLKSDFESEEKQNVIIN